MEQLLHFFSSVGNLKGIKRAGWGRVGVTNQESVADHSWRTALMALVMAKRLGLNAERAATLGLIHDIAEATIGDLMPGEVTKEVKQIREHEAVIEFGKLLGVEGDELLSLWEEAEFGKSDEAKLVKELDKLEMALQAKEYEAEDSARNLEEFIESAARGIQSREVSELLESVKNLQRNG
jgi:putative hydrolases of HD superfamily